VDTTLGSFTFRSVKNTRKLLLSSDVTNWKNVRIVRSQNSRHYSNNHRPHLMYVINKTGNVRINVRLRRVRVTCVAVEQPLASHIPSVCR
jgi:hypothetical protein